MAKQVVIRRATEIDRIAPGIIGEFHAHLLDCRVLYLFTTKESHSRGKLVWAKTSKLTDKERWFSSYLDGEDVRQYDFLIMFDVTAWMEHADDPEWQVALVDHELCHIVEKADEDGELMGEFVLAPHDVEEFTAIVQRRGLWEASLKAMGYVIGDQLKMGIS